MSALRWLRGVCAVVVLGWAVFVSCIVTQIRELVLAARLDKWQQPAVVFATAGRCVVPEIQMPSRHPGSG